MPSRRTLPVRSSRSSTRRRQRPETRIRARKWRQAVKAVDWLTAQLPRESQYQIYVFDTAARPLVPGSDGVWLPVKDVKALDKAIVEFGQEARLLAAVGAEYLVHLPEQYTDQHTGQATESGELDSEQWKNLVTGTDEQFALVQLKTDVVHSLRDSSLSYVIDRKILDIQEDRSIS